MRFPPCVVHERVNLGDEERLPDDFIAFIHAADTAFLSTSYVSAQEVTHTYPSRLGIDYSRGRPGFVRVKPSDGKTLALPNYGQKVIIRGMVYYRADLVTMSTQAIYSLGNTHMLEWRSPRFMRGQCSALPGKLRPCTA